MGMKPTTAVYGRPQNQEHQDAEWKKTQALAERTKKKRSGKRTSVYSSNRRRRGH